MPLRRALQRSFFWLAILAASATLTPSAFAGQQRTPFDHLTTGFELLGQHRDLPCESCHVNAVFKGTPTNCDACHGVGTLVRATAKTPGHILSTNRCEVCHTPDAWSPAVNFDHAQTMGSCSSCHNGVQAQGKGPQHVTTNLQCDACHSTVGWAGATFSHAGITSGCSSCHNGKSATGMATGHIPIGSLDCNASGCHSTSNINAGGFRIGAASINTPTLDLAGHTSVAAAVPACQTCHEAAPYLGMLASTVSAAGDSRPTALDKYHPTSGDCGSCHTTKPTFAGNVTGAAKPPNHIPTNAPCAQCHTTPGNYLLYSVVGTHQGATNCLSCHGPTVAGSFANITITTLPGTHIPIGSLDCNGSGCHSTANVSKGGFRIGSANITTPTLNVAGHTTVAGAVPSCQTCHQGAAYLGMVASTATSAGDSRPTALDKSHPTSGDCSACHTTTPTFATDITGSAGKPANHIPTTAPCAQCHTILGNYALYSVVGTHIGVTGCAACHGPTVNTTFANITIATLAANHIPIGSLDCNGSGCHTTSNVNPGGFHIGSANINTPTLTPAGHATVALAVAGCQTCHETAPYLGMTASTASTAGDSRPTALDASHPTSGDCGSCHSTTPTFAGDLTGGAPKPPGHIPTNAPCAQCHTTSGNFAVYSVVGTHVGVTNCLSCHASTVNTTFLNVTITTTPGNHIPIGTLDCNGSGCHTTTNVSPGGFHLRAANINTPTLTVAGHTTVASAVAGCQTCHETAPYLGMLVSTATTAGDSRPTALDKSHPTTGDCNGCHTTTPTFGGDVTGKPANHIPTTAPCAQCHTTAGNYALYSVPGTHVGVTKCLTCHAPAVATTFANVTITSTPGNHIPIGTLDCNGSGCHTTANVNPGGFHLGSANINTPTLTTTGHTTIASAVAGCQTCHETAPYLGMVASTATTAGDSRPTALDKSHPTTGDCNGCHTTTPTFGGDVTGKPANHIPTSQPCTLCHTTPGNYAVYVMGAKGHTGIASGCATCHGPSVANTFANIRIKTTPSNHVPYGSAACESCHSASNFTAFGPGTQVNHTAVAALACDACHEYNMANMWYGVTNLTVRPGTPPSGHHYPQDCKGCHSPGGSWSNDAAPGPSAKSVTRPGGSAATTQAVAAGAVTPATGTTAATGTSPVTGSPGTTTSGTNALSTRIAGAGVAAANSTASGSVVANTGAANTLAVATAASAIGTRPTFIDHSRLLGSCLSCHNGASAQGKPLGHVASNSACANCHTTNGWIPARFDHISVAPHTCTTCHDTVHAVGKPRGHGQTSQQCDSCHGTLAWMPVMFDHATATGTCASCHNNAGAVGKPANHMTTQRDCASCHTAQNWSTVAFRHASTRYPGQHHATLTCVTCHTTNAEQLPYPAAAYAGTCGGCHFKDFNPAAHPKAPKGRFYSAGELANCSGACHVYSDSTQTTIVRSLPGPYHRVSDATFKR